MKEQIPIAYIVSRFPKLTETFVLYEREALRRLGFRVWVMPLQVTRESVSHPEARQSGTEVLDAPWCSLRTAAINLKWLARHPLRYLGTALRAAAGTLGSLKFFAGAVVFFPKAVVFADQAQRLGIAHIHAHFASHPALVAWVAHQLCGVSYSFTAHGTDLHADQRMLRQKARDAAFAVTISTYNRRFIAERCGEDTAGRFEVIRCGVDRAVFTPRVSPETNDRLQIICIAAFRAVKGHRHLIDACARLLARGVAFDCRLVGYGPLQGAIERQIQRMGLQAHVRLTGPQSRPDVVRLLGVSDVCVLTSVQVRSGSREGIPVALMEAMACELPVVASRISGIPELVEDGVSGILVPPGDPDAIAAALEHLATRPERRAHMGAKAREQIQEFYDLTQNSRVLAQRIQAACDRCGPRCAIPHPIHVPAAPGT